MKPTILTPAILMTAALLGTTAAHAQSAAAAKAYPPGPSAQAYPPGPTAQAWPPGPTAQAYPPGPSVEAYPPGPTGQATAQTTNVNVVNVPTVAVGNVVTVREGVKEPLYFQKALDMGDGVVFVESQFVVPPGKRLLLENVNVSCSSVSAQAVAVALYADIPSAYPVATLMPAAVPWGNISFAAQLYRVQMLVDGALTLSAFRSLGAGATSCVVTLIGSLGPLQ